MEQRGRRRSESNYEEDETLTKDIKNSKRKGKRADILRSLSVELDEREHWRGIKRLRKQYQPIPYSSTDKH